MSLGSGLSMPFWDFLGSTVITSNYIRLTSDLQSKSGAVWNTVVTHKYFVFWKILILFNNIVSSSHVNQEIGNFKSNLRFMDMEKTSSEMD